ncbi:MAG: dTDP-4-keto-6-deoxy-D-glucose epimerase [bacterium]|nr:dTDP-4-keto-6-deoxy-D-glucose epimerase [bacterium]
MPVGFAHSFVALEDETLIHYRCAEIYTPSAPRASSSNDPTVGIEWSLERTLIT